VKPKAVNISKPGEQRAAKADNENVAVFSYRMSYRNALAVGAHTSEENLVELITC
jgi:hypothetical protein